MIWESLHAYFQDWMWLGRLWGERNNIKLWQLCVFSVQHLIRREKEKSFPLPHLSGQGVKVRLLSRATNSPHGLTSLPLKKLKKQVLKTTVMLVTSSLLPSYFKLVLYYWHKPYYCRMISSPPRALCRAIPINFFLGSWPVSHTWVAVSILWSSTGKVTSTYFQMGLFILQHLWKENK